LAKFKYKFDSIRKVKESLEKKAQKEVNEIEMKIAGENQKISDLENEKIRIHSELKSKQHARASELQFLISFEDTLDERIKTIKTEIVGLEKKKEEKLQALIQKTKEHKVFDALEQKYKEDFIYEENHIEQKEMDEIASMKKKKEF